MAKRVLVLLTAIVLGTTGALGQHSEHDYKREQEKQKQLYTCPMHPQVVRAEPGHCPICGMILVPLKDNGKRRTSNELPMSKSEEMHNSNRMAMPMHERGEHDHEMSMQSSLNIVDPMSREGSGTSWLPDSSPMYGRMFMFGEDMLMLHGAVFPRYTNVSTRRGDDRIDAPNWVMAMFSHPVDNDTQLGLRAMMSLDLLTEGGRGYPLLFQSGESWHDQPLHDRQHPHDLFDELSVAVSHKFDVNGQSGSDLSGYIYFGYPGEPALGPPTFMHRVSAMDDPDAPLSHHWQDSTHVTFGVATLGGQWRSIKIEGSIFTGREPDENRYDFDRPRFDSYSGRVSWNPMQNLALQVSHGYIKSPEALEPDVKRHRTTASIIYNRPIDHDSNWSNTFVWGQNHDTGEGRTQSFLIESNYQHGRDTIYARWERVEKSGHELVLRTSNLGEIFPVNAASIGYVRDFCHGDKIDIGLGGQFTIDIWPDELDRYYGGGPGYGFQFFLRVRPSRHVHAGMQME